jgi:hypothetical protein
MAKATHVERKAWWLHAELMHSSFPSLSRVSSAPSRLASPSRSRSLASGRHSGCRRDCPEQGHRRPPASRATGRWHERRRNEHPRTTRSGRWNARRTDEGCQRERSATAAEAILRRKLLQLLRNLTTFTSLPFFTVGIPDIAESFLGGRGGNTGTGVHQQSAGVPASSGGGIKGMLMKDANGNGQCTAGAEDMMRSRPDAQRSCSCL